MLPALLAAVKQFYLEIPPLAAMLAWYLAELAGLARSPPAAGGNVHSSSTLCVERGNISCNRFTFNMTRAAQHFGKRLDNFLSNDLTKDYITELEQTLTSNHHQTVGVKIVDGVPGGRHVLGRGTSGAGRLRRHMGTPETQISVRGV